MNILAYATLDMAQPMPTTRIYAKQNDELSRYIVAQLVNAGQPWTPPNAALAIIRYRKPDGTGGFYDTDESGQPAVVTGENGQYTLTLAAQSLTVPGGVGMELNFYTAAGQKLTTFAWQLQVEPSVLSDTQIESSDYYNILSEQITQILGKVDSIAELTASVQSVPYGATATVEVTGGTGSQDPYNLNFKIPAAFSPSLNLTREDNVVTLTVEDEQGIESESITEPLISVTQDGPNIIISATDTNGTTQAEVLRGSVRLATFDVDPETGQLLMYAPEAFDELTFAINNDGQLTVAVNQ